MLDLVDDEMFGLSEEGSRVVDGMVTNAEVFEVLVLILGKDILD